jgi:hypothetical protein
MQTGANGQTGKASSVAFAEDVDVMYAAAAIISKVEWVEPTVGDPLPAQEGQIFRLPVHLWWTGLYPNQGFSQSVTVNTAQVSGSCVQMIGADNFNLRVGVSEVQGERVFPIAYMTVASASTCSGPTTMTVQASISYPIDHTVCAPLDSTASLQVAPPVQVAIDPFVGVCQSGEATATLKVMSGASSVTVNLETIRVQGGRGDAFFVETNSRTRNNVTITSSGTPVRIRGVTRSDVVDNMELRVKLASNNQQVAAHRFSVVALARLDVHDAILQTTSLGNYHLASVSDNNVAVDANLNPDISVSTGAGIISWTGGEPSPSAPLRRIVTTSTPNTLTTVSAQCGSESMSVLIVVARGCGTGVQDDRTRIQGEYLFFWASSGLGIFDPMCNEFTRSAGSQYFSFAELNTGDYSWALIREPLVIPAASGYGLDRWRAEYGSSRIINSAYRNPVRNQNAGGRANSRHQFGDAVDFRNQTRTQGEWDLMVLAARRARADFIESLEESGIGHVHADWRNHAGGYAQ